MLQQIGIYSKDLLCSVTGVDLFCYEKQKFVMNGNRLYRTFMKASSNLRILFLETGIMKSIPDSFS